MYLQLLWSKAAPRGGSHHRHSCSDCAGMAMHTVLSRCIKRQPSSIRPIDSPTFNILHQKHWYRPGPSDPYQMNFTQITPLPSRRSGGQHCRQWPAKIPVQHGRHISLADRRKVPEQAFTCSYCRLRQAPRSVPTTYKAHVLVHTYFVGGIPSQALGVYPLCCPVCRGCPTWGMSYHRTAELSAGPFTGEDTQQAKCQ